MLKYIQTTDITSTLPKVELAGTNHMRHTHDHVTYHMMTLADAMDIYDPFICHPPCHKVSLRVKILLTFLWHNSEQVLPILRGE